LYTIYSLFKNKMLGSLDFGSWELIGGLKVVNVTNDLRGSVQKNI